MLDYVIVAAIAFGVGVLVERWRMREKMKRVDRAQTAHREAMSKLDMNFGVKATKDGR